MSRLWRDKNIPGKGVVNSKVPGSQAPSAGKRSAGIMGSREQGRGQGAVITVPQREMSSGNIAGLTQKLPRK